jgi:ribosomal protein L28
VTWFSRWKGTDAGRKKMIAIEVNNCKLSSTKRRIRPNLSSVINTVEKLRRLMLPLDSQSDPVR